MGRSILAVVAGFAVIGALSFGTDAVLRSAVPAIWSSTGRVDSPLWLLVILLYVFVYAVFGCWLTGRLAPNRPLRHAKILGVLGLAFNIFGSIATWETAPAWYHVVALALVMPAAWLGGTLADRRALTLGASPS